MTVNLAFLSLSPLQLFCYNELLRQGRLQPDFLPADIHRFIDSLPKDERESLAQVFANSPFAPARDIPS